MPRYKEPVLAESWGEKVWLKNLFSQIKLVLLCERSKDIPLDTQDFRKQITPITFLEKNYLKSYCLLKAESKLRVQNGSALLKEKKKKSKSEHWNQRITSKKLLLSRDTELNTNIKLLLK